MQKDKQYLRLFFDMDNTLTRSRTPITPEMKERLESLPHDVVVVSGQDAASIRSQLEGLDCYILGQNGNDAWHNDEQLWNDALKDEERKEILDHIASLPRDWDVPDEDDLIEDRGCSISYSLYGHHASIETKERFDPDQVRRVNLLQEHPLNSETVDVKIGGTTTLDYFRKGHNKGYNIMRLTKRFDWNLDTCLYFGDALFPGGNDETVIGIVDTEAVKNPEDTFNKLTELL